MSSTPLSIDVYVAPMRPYISPDQLGEGEVATWAPSSSTLISGPTEGILIDAKRIRTAMPMIDVYAPNDLLPSGSDRRIGDDPSLAKRTWVLLTEAAEGGWGIGGTAFGREEFTALAAAARK